MRGIPWTDKETQYLMDHFFEPAKELCKVIKRTPQAIQARKQHLKDNGFNPGKRAKKSDKVWFKKQPVTHTDYGCVICCKAKRALNMCSLHYYRYHLKVRKSEGYR